MVFVQAGVALDLLLDGSDVDDITSSLTFASNMIFSNFISVVPHMPLTEPCSLKMSPACVLQKQHVPFSVWHLDLQDPASCVCDAPFPTPPHPTHRKATILSQPG